MARQLYFRNVAIGTHFIAMPPAATLVTPPGILPGVFQPKAAVSSLSRNLLYKMTMTIALKAATEVAFAEAAMAIQEYQGLTGLLEVRDGGSTPLTWRDAVFFGAPAPSILPGFGGLFTAEWPLDFVSSLRPEFA